MDASSDEDLIECTPPSVTEEAKKTSLNLLPKKSQERYEICYNQFMKRRKEKGISSSFSENVLIVYIEELSKKIKPNTLWTQYSMLRSTLNVYHDVDITKYLKLKALLKRKSNGYVPKKSKTLTTEQIHQFIREAPDTQYLFTKVALIVGIAGACRKQELCEIKIDNIEDLGSAVLIKLPDTKTNKPRSFTITGEFYEIFKKYNNLRPSNENQHRFFLNYQQGKCTKQPVGVNKFGNIPKVIANYLHLQNPELYTGHCFRRSSATILVDAGGDITTLKRHGGWKSTTVAESYIEESLKNKMEVANKILQAVNEPAASSSATLESEPSLKKPRNAQTIQELSQTINSQTHPIHLTNCYNNNITINFCANNT